MPTKKTILVVKSLRDLSPKKQLLVTRKFEEKDAAVELEISQLGNHSPSKPTRQKDGSIMSRSILGDVTTFETIDKALRHDTQRVQTGQSEREKAVDRQGTGNSKFGMSRGRVSPTTVPIENVSKEEEAEINILEDPSAYLELLNKQKGNATKKLSADIDREASLVQYLPLHERMSYNKEEKVLLRWQERQKEWIKIEAEISSKIDAKSSHALMMATTEEFRARKEEYELLYAAIPFRDRFGPYSWQMTLRGGCPRLVSIGHIFSGLECEVDKHPPAPPIIRKPLASKKFKRGNHFMEETKALTSRRKKLSHEIESLRPHLISFDHAASLVVFGEDLFEWAIKSTKGYFADIGGYEMDQITSSSEASSLGLYEQPSHIDRSKCIIECESTEATMSTTVGRTSLAQITLTNRGPVAMTFAWTPLIPSDECENEGLNTTPTTEVGRLLDACQSKVGGKNRERELITRRRLFNCLRPQGRVLPGQSVTTTFMFTSEVAGVFHEKWRLTCTPRAEFRVSSIAVRSNQNEQEIVLTPSIFNLHGMAMELDLTKHRRESLRDTMNASTFECMIRDEFTRCFRRVRLPIRRRNLDDRIVDAFTKRNRTVLDQIVCGSRYAEAFPLFVTVDRVAAIGDLVAQTSSFCAMVRGVLMALRVLASTSDLDALKVAIDGAKESTNNQLEHRRLSEWLHDLQTNQLSDVNTTTINSMKQQIQGISEAHKRPEHIEELKVMLLPEGSLDVFDQVQIEDFYLPWDLQVQVALNALNESIFGCEEIEELEKSALIRLKQYEKVLRKRAFDEKKRLEREARWYATQHLDDDDDEEEEEEEYEEEEEEEEEVDEDAVKPVHPLRAAADAGLFRLRAALTALVTKPRDSSKAETVLKSGLEDLLDRFDDIRSQAFESSGLQTQGPLPVIESPFISEAGKQAWEAVLNETTVAAAPEPANAKKGGKGAAAAAAAGPTPQQTNACYRSMYNTVHEGLLKIMDDCLGVFDEQNTQDLISADRGESFHVEKVMDSAVTRQSDVSQFPSFEEQKRGKIVLVNSPGHLFANTESFSAFDSRGQQQTRFLSELKTLAESGAEALVLLYESPIDLDKPPLWASSSDNIQRQLIQLNNQKVDFEKKVHEKKMRKWRRADEKLQRKIRKWHRAFRDQELTAEKALSLGLVLDPVRDSILDLDYRVRSLRSIADLKVAMEELSESSISLVESPSTSVTQVDDTLAIHHRTVTVWLLENLRAPGVVPTEPPLGDEVDGDDDAPIAIGGNEYMSYRRKRHEQSRPHRVTVQTSSTSNGMSKSVTCYADDTASVLEIMHIAESSKFNAQWVDATTHNLFASESASCLQRVSNEHAKPQPPLLGSRILSLSVRESLLFASLLQASALNRLSLLSTESSTKSMVDSTFATKETPIATVLVIGGELRSDKFRVLDEALSLVDQVFICGEMAIPFLAYLNSIDFTRYRGPCLQFQQACRAVIGRARSLGVTLHLPVDIQVSDEDLPPASHRYKLVYNFYSSQNPIESRDDGFEYSGDAKSTIVESLAGGSVSGYVFDLGNTSIANLRNIVAKSDLAVVWGNPSASECSSFQSATKALSESINRNNAAAAGRVPQHTVVVGQSTVEWLSRFIDPDNEFGGNLAEYGAVSHVCRDSSVLVGVVGHIASSVLRNGVTTRISQSEEVKLPLYTVKSLNEEEEEEEEED